MSANNHEINRLATGLMLLATVLFSLGGCGGKGFFKGRVKRMSGTYEGSVDLTFQGQVSSYDADIEIREGSSSDLLIDMEDAVLKAEITGRDTFEIIAEDHGLPQENCGNKVEISGDGEVVDNELQLEMEWDWPNCTVDAEFEGEKL